MATLTSMLGVGQPPAPAARGAPPISGRDYLLKLRKYLGANLPRLAPPKRDLKGAPRDATWLQQSYTILTLGLDPSSAALSPSVKIPLTLGFGSPASPTRQKPLLLRLPPDKLLYLLLRWQSLPQSLPHVGRTDVPVPDGIRLSTRGVRSDLANLDGDVESVRSWVGSIRSVSMPMKEGFWWSKPKEVDEDKILRELYGIFNTLPGLLIHPPFAADSQIDELLDAGGYTAFGGVDVRVPLDVLRNLQVLELDSFDPRGLLIPPNPILHSLSVHDIEDADDWIEELLVDIPPAPPKSATPPSNSITPLESPSDLIPRFPNLRFLSLTHTSLLNFPQLPLTSLSHLDLSHNLLNSIPDALSSLHSLVSLNLSDNVITSVRNAPAALGNIHTINLARNRIDCLVGLDRVLGLRRVDVRANTLTEAGEVGRLAVLPEIEAVWAAENPFTAAEGWRAELGASFAAEERNVVLDETPLAWSEQRAIDVILAARGRARPAWRDNRDSERARDRTDSGFEPAERTQAKEHSPTPASRQRDLVPTPTARMLAPSPTPSPAKAVKRRPRRRVVNLDGERVEDVASTRKGKKKEGNGTAENGDSGSPSGENGQTQG